MPERMALVKPPEPEPQPKTFPTGSTLLDLAIGGGWGHGRVINIVGDRATGKSLLAIEACANFAHKFGDRNIRYNETEGGGFDRDYAHNIGLPSGITFVGGDGGVGSYTIEEFTGDIKNFVTNRKGPSFYVLDSLDAVSDEEEMAREEIKRTFRTAKPAAVSEYFRKEMKRLDEGDCSLMIVSQIRDKIGVTFGETKTRSGGHALDFYASQIIWLAEVGKEKHSIDGIDHVTGVRILANVKKNKLGKPYAQVEFIINFNYGVDDELSNINWLKKYKLGCMEGKLSYPIDKYKGAVENARRKYDRDAILGHRAELQGAVKGRWAEIQSKLQPTIHKYE